MKKKTFWIIAGIALAVLALLVIWQTMQINAIASSGTSTVKAAASTAASSSSGMVGGC
jgi:hypothetical protein